MKKVLFISSEGGHLHELRQLDFKKYDYSIVTEKTDSTKNLKDKYKNKVHYLAYGTRKNLFKYFFVLLYNFFKSLFLFCKLSFFIILFRYHI